MNDNEFRAVDLLQIVSLMLGYENLMENRQQSADNNVQAANDKQAKFILDEINRKFEEQNKLLEDIAERVKRIENN